MEAYKKGVYDYIKEDYVAMKSQQDFTATPYAPAEGVAMDFQQNSTATPRLSSEAKHEKNLVKEEVLARDDALSQEVIPRKYFSGGLQIGAVGIRRSSSPIIGSGFKGQGFRANVRVEPTGDGRIASSPVQTQPEQLPDVVVQWESDMKAAMDNRSSLDEALSDVPEAKRDLLIAATQFYEILTIDQDSSQDKARVTRRALRNNPNIAKSMLTYLDDGIDDSKVLQRIQTAKPESATILKDFFTTIIKSIESTTANLHYNLQEQKISDPIPIGIVFDGRRLAGLAQSKISKIVYIRDHQDFDAITVITDTNGGNYAKGGLRYNLPIVRDSNGDMILDATGRRTLGPVGAYTNYRFTMRDVIDLSRTQLPKNELAGTPYQGAKTIMAVRTSEAERRKIQNIRSWANTLVDTGLIPEYVAGPDGGMQPEEMEHIISAIRGRYRNHLKHEVTMLRTDKHLDFTEKITHAKYMEALTKLEEGVKGVFFHDSYMTMMRNEIILALNERRLDPVKLEPDQKLSDAIERIIGAGATGKVLKHAELAVTAHSVVEGIVTILNYLGLRKKQLRIAVPGAGDVGASLALKLNRRGELVTAISDAHGTVHKPGGFTTLELQRLVNIEDVRKRNVLHWMPEEKGMTITRYAHMMLDMVEMLDVPVRGTFNRIQLTAEKGTTVDAIEQAYKHAYWGWEEKSKGNRVLEEETTLESNEGENVEKFIAGMVAEQHNVGGIVIGKFGEVTLKAREGNTTEELARFYNQALNALSAKAAGADEVSIFTGDEGVKHYLTSQIFDSNLIPADVITPAASVPRLIHSGNIEQFRGKDHPGVQSGQKRPVIIFEGGNNSFEGMERTLEHRGILAGSGIHLNWGGVFASYMEDLMKHKLTDFKLSQQELVRRGDNKRRTLINGDNNVHDRAIVTNDDGTEEIIEITNGQVSSKITDILRGTRVDIVEGRLYSQGEDLHYKVKTRTTTIRWGSFQVNLDKNGVVLKSNHPDIQLGKSYDLYSPLDEIKQKLYTDITQLARRLNTSIMELYQLKMIPARAAERIADAIDARKAKILATDEREADLKEIMSRYREEGYVLTENAARNIAATEIALSDPLSTEFSGVDLVFNSETGQIEKEQLQELGKSAESDTVKAAATALYDKRYGGRVIEGDATSSPLSSSPVVQGFGSTSDEIGGIDMNEINVNRQGGGVDIQFDPIEIQSIIDRGITGFTPVIINITPLPSVLPLLGLAPKEEEEELMVSKLN